MLVVNPLTPAAAAYYFGDREAGRWVGCGSGELGLGGAVDRRSLVAVLEGRHPGDLRFLPAWKPARRRAGWDLTLAAPKSVSLLAALATGGAGMAAAHRDAVGEVVGHFERQVLTLRRTGAPGGSVASAGVVGAAFDHHTNASGEPHLHTHLILCNLGRAPDGLWSAIDPGWWTVRRSLGAVYQLGLRHHLRSQGFDLEWRKREDGFADVVGVPRAAVRSASGRGRAAAADRAAFGSVGAGRRSGVRAGATAQTRRAALAQPWRAQAEGAGLGTAEADRLVHQARASGQLPLGHADVTSRVTARLASQRSWFRQADVLVALAASAPAGCTGTEAEQWTARFCAAAIAVAGRPGSSPRWTTAGALGADQRLAGRAAPDFARSGGPGRRPGDVSVPVAWPGLSPAGSAAAQRLLASARPVEILQSPPGRTNLLAHAAALEAAGLAWRAAGQRIAVATASDEAAIRWQALTGIDRFRSGGPADVVLVDHADRRATPELLALLGALDQQGARAVLIEGGTSPRLTWRCSDGLAWLGDRLGRIDPGPAPAWSEAVTAPSTWDRRPSQEIAGCPTATEAVRHLLSGWAQASAAAEPAVLVGLGYAEADGLNQAARAVLERAGQISGPALACGGRVVQAGDRMLALRRISADLPLGARLEVAEVDTRRSVATVTDGTRSTTLDRHSLASLGYGYAVTPPLAARAAGALMVLGPPDALGPHLARVVAAAVVTPTRLHDPARSPRQAREWEHHAGMGIG